MKVINIIIIIIFLFVFKLITLSYHNTETFNKKYIIDKSNIHNDGIFATQKINKNEKIDLAIKIDNKRNIFITPYIGRKINHCEINNNTYLKKEGNSYYIYAKKDIIRGEELTINYHTAPAFIQKPKNNFKIC